MTFQYELAGSQIDGARDYQEDAFLITHLTDMEGNPSALVIVADGMGGHAAGNVASNMAVQAFNKHVSTGYPTDKPAEILRECVLKANASIHATVKETPALAGMGCTMVAAIIEGNKLWWVSVGDSHIYVIRNKELIKKNADHSYGGFLDKMAAAGTPIEPEPGLSRNMLMSAVTGDKINEIDVPDEPFELKDGDRLLICSDGMDTLSAGKIIQFSEWSETPKEYAEALMKAVEDIGMPKQDNTTAVIVNISDKEQAASAAEQPQPAAEEAADDLKDTDKNKVKQEPVVEEIDLNKTFDEVLPEQTPPPPQETVTVEDQPKKINTGLIIGIAAVLIIGIAVAVFMTMAGKKQPPATTSIDLAGTEQAEPEDAPDKQLPVPEKTVAATTVEPAVTVEKTEQAATLKAKEGKEFSDTLKDGTAGPAMIKIPAATFDMGSPGTSRHADERPRHSVKISQFAISKYEISFAEYDKFAKATDRKVPDNLYMDRKTHPVIFISWDDAYYYSRWLSEQTGKKYRLPSESEWEYAAGTGKRSPYWWGFDEEPGRAHCFGCGTGLDPRKPTKLGSFKPNELGVYDTAGNVAEWVKDCWHDTYKGAPTDGSVWEGGDCSYRVSRGGAYSSPPASIRHTTRDKFKSDQVYDHIGIRVVRDP